MGLPIHLQLYLHKQGTCRIRWGLLILVPIGLGYPANVGGLGLNSPNIILQTSLQPAAQLTTQS